MRLAFIVSAYKQPEMLERLVRRLQGRPCYIHVDLRTPAAVWARMEAALRDVPGVVFLRRHACRWGDFGHVEATLKGLRALSQIEYDYVALLTGQCYPLREVEQMEAELEGWQGKSRIQIEPLPWKQWPRENGGYKRIDRFHFPLILFKKRLWIKLWRRKLPYNLHPYGGSGYWCISRQCAEAILRFVEIHPKYSRFFQKTYTPDELFFQTILGNLPARGELISEGIHYMEWPGPAVLNEQAVGRALASDRWFARKLADPRLLEQIDQALNWSPL